MRSMHTCQGVTLLRISFSCSYELWKNKITTGRIITFSDQWLFCDFNSWMSRFTSAPEGSTLWVCRVECELSVNADTLYVFKLGFSICHLVPVPSFTAPTPDFTSADIIISFGIKISENICVNFLRWCSSWWWTWNRMCKHKSPQLPLILWHCGLDSDDFKSF